MTHYLNVKDVSAYTCKIVVDHEGNEKLTDSLLSPHKN